MSTVIRHTPNELPASLARRLSAEELTRLNIGRRYWPARLADMHDPDGSVLEEQLMKYVVDLPGMMKSGWGLYLHGPNSTGKTHAAAALLQHVVSNGYTGYCILADELKSAYVERPMFDENLTVPQRAESVDMLVIEDIGKEFAGAKSGWAETCFENLLRKRVREMRQTVLTSNLSPAEFKARYKDSSAALAREAVIAVEVQGIDWRARKAAERRALERGGDNG